MLQQIKRTGSRCLLLVPLGLIVLLFECVPLVSMFVKAFSENGHFSLAQFGTIAHQLVYRTAIINSLWVTLLSTAVGLVIDFFLALALYGDHGRKKTLYLSLLNLTSTFSGVPLTIAFITMMGTSGVLVLLGSILLQGHAPHFPRGKVAAECCALGLWQTTTQYAFYYIAVAMLTGAFGGILNSTQSFLGVIFAHFIYGNADRMTPAKTLGFVHPITGEQLRFDSELPDYFTHFLATLRRKNT